jgi:hypothetical protein
MRQIKISAVGYPGKTHYIKFNMYSVFLGNESKNYFSNLKDAKQFVADTNRFLNLKLHEFNQVYISILSEYQRNWFYFDSQNGKANKNLSFSEGKITDNLQAIIKAMNFMVNRSGSPNGNYYTYSNFFNCLDYSAEILNNLIIVLKERKHYVEIKSCEILNSQLVKIREDINSYGKSPHIEENIIEIESAG